MNMGAEADAFVADYDARVAALGANLGDAGDEMFIVGRWTAEGPQIMAPSTFSSRILIDVGMQPPAEIPELQLGHPHSAPLSLESVGVIDVDWAFLGTLQGQGDSVEALELELWPEHGWDCFDYVKASEVVGQDASDESQWADARLRYMATPEGLERSVEISHRIETEHATALDKKLSYPQYQVTQKKEYIDLALQGEL
ncbi:MAG: hypothetical protein OXG78_12640 [Chloroflexi bacterium]|nr:hypothetical protein [Chloroflexota bacterium]